MKRRFFCALAALFLLAGLLPVSASEAAEEPLTSAKAAAVMEVSSGRVLYEDNADAHCYPASTTKVLTALLTLESCSLDETATIPDACVGREGSSIYLARGERMTVGDLLYGLMLSSGNDAAETLACHVAGSVDAFAQRMNERAAELGCTDSQFRNPHGLPDEGHYTSAHDLCTIAVHAMRNEAFREIVSTKYHEAGSGDIPRTWKNKNKMLWNYNGGCGVKTGYTKAAGRCLVFAAQREGMTLVGVVLNAPDMWSDAEKLLDYGFSRVKLRRLLSAETAWTIPVEDGEKKSLRAGTKEDILYPILCGGSDTVTWRTETAGTLSAPVHTGDRVGALTLLVNGNAVGTYEIVAEEDVGQRQTIWSRILGFFA